MILAAATAAVAWAPRLLHDPGRMSRLVAVALPELAADVTFREVRPGWLGPIVLEDIRVVPRDGAPQPLAVERIEVANGLAAILFSFGDLGRVRVGGLESDVVFADDGTSNLAGLFRRDPAVAGGPSGGPPRRSAVRMRVEVEAATVRIAGPWSPDAWRSEPIDLVATLAPSPTGAGSDWTIEPVELLADARLDPGVARSVLAYIAPVLAGATRTSGRFSLRLDAARLPVGMPIDATLSGALEMHEVAVGPGPLVENLLGSLPVPLPLPPDIRIADESRVSFRLADRRMTHDGLEFGLPLGRSGRRLDVRSSGSVSLEDGGLDLTLRLPIPADLPQDRPVVAALAGKTVSIGVEGTLRDPRVAFDGSIREAAGDFVGDLVDRLRSDAAGGAAPGSGESSPEAETAEAVVDLVGGILQELARRRAERREVEPERPPAGRLRRPRDGRRSVPPQMPAP